ncbi:MAG: FAD-dependent oxidoreductase [Paracoccaceae bacterium]
MSTAAKKVVIVGAGIVGLSTACRMAEDGYDVTVIEKERAPGAGTSKANAGQLLFDRIGAMGSPGFLRSLPGTLVDPSQGVRAYGLAHPLRWPWLGAFLRECTQTAWQQNTRRLLELAHVSRAAMHGFSTRHTMEFDWRQPGKLITYATEKALASASRSADFQGQFGGRHHVVSRDACIEHEPALHKTGRQIAGGIHLPDAEVGDCNKCCQELARILVEQLGGTIHFETPVLDIVRKGGRVLALQTDRQAIVGDLFVLATGMATQKLLRDRFAGKKPIVGVMGISLTYPVADGAPNLSVTDALGKFVVVRLGQRLRVTGNAVFTDRLRASPQDIERLKFKAQTLMPAAARYNDPPEVWAGARPQTPDDLPMIGRAGAQNLFVNAGHGSLGWTLAFGSAEALLQAIKSV